MKAESKPSLADQEPSADPQRDALKSATPINVALSVALIVLLLPDVRNGFEIGDPATVSLLAVVAWLSESFASVVQRFSSVSLLSTLIGVAVVLCGPLGAALVGITGGLFLGRWPLPVRLFNGLMSAVMAAVGGLAFTYLADGSDGQLTWVRDNIETLVIPIAVTTLVMLLVNAFLVGLVIRVTAGVPFSRSLRDFGEHGFSLFLVGGLISYLIVVLWVGAGVGPLTIIVMAPPLLLVQWASSATVAEASSADHAVDALVASLELNRPGSKAHGDLVAVIAEELGNITGLSDDEVHQLRRAARLHHIGSISTAHTGSVALDTRMRQHGAHLLDGVEFLSPVRRIITAQDNTIRSASSPADILAIADLVAGSLERGLAGADTPPTRSMVDQCIDDVAQRSDLQPGVRQTVTALLTTTLPDRLVVRRLGDLSSPTHVTDSS